MRPELSKKNKYWVEKNRFCELKYFCLQYPIWKKEYDLRPEVPSSVLHTIKVPLSEKSDPTERAAIEKLFLSKRMRLVERCAEEADPFLAKYIMKCVTEGYSYNYLRTTLNIPCERDIFYATIRKFYWLLSMKRG